MTDRDDSRRASAWLAVRSILMTLLLPGLVAYYVPWRFFGLREVRFGSLGALQVLGLVCAAAGTVLLLACIWEFARSGRGTLAPVDPPRRLVVRGLYRYVRNPMYLSVTAILLGEALVARSEWLLLFWTIWFLVANLFVILYEERTLRRRFGDEYAEYTRRVGRWLPRL